MAWSIWKYLKKELTIKLDNEIQVKIFLLLYEYPKGMTRNLICERLEIPRTTVYDNICKLFDKRYYNIPYIKVYSEPSGLKGRPKTIFYIPKGIRNKTLTFKLNSN